VVAAAVAAVEVSVLRPVSQSTPCLRTDRQTDTLGDSHYPAATELVLMQTSLNICCTSVLLAKTATYTTRSISQSINQFIRQHLRQTGTLPHRHIRIGLKYAMLTGH